MLVCVLGPVEVRDASRDVAVGGRRARLVLARLALEANRTVALGSLESAAWAEAPPVTARYTIATHVLRLRRAGLAISTAKDGYSLQTATDASEFERLVMAGREAAEPELASSLLREALAHWRASPFQELDHVPEAAIEAARLEELAAGSREELLAAELEGAPSIDVVGSARRLVAEHPYRERRWELLMLALYRAGRQAESLEAFAEARRRLVDDLGLEPGPVLRRIQHAVLAQDPALEPTPSGLGVERLSSHGLPGTATRLIGRTRERRDLEQVWDRARIVTLVGPPGAGKSRLALEAAYDAASEAWYVPLEQLPAEQSVAAVVLDAVAASSRANDARDGVLNALQASAGLLILDGCERRLQEVAAEVTAIVRSCPAVGVLATSRERLGLLDEALVPVGPLPEGDAIELLVDRARLVDPRFALATGEAETARRLCAMVDRLPLGLELVARHLRLLGVQEVAQRVEADLGRWAGQPAGGRAGLWAALDASMRRLGSDEKLVLVALAVMVADADNSLVAQVAGAHDREADVFEAVGRLVDASLVQVRSATGTVRYELLRTVSVYTLESTDAASVEAAQARYRDAVLARAAELALRLDSADRSATLHLLDREMPHVRAVLGNLCARPVDAVSATVGLETAVALSDYWLGRHPAEGLEWLGRLIDCAAPVPALRADAKGHALAALTLAHWKAGEPSAAMGTGGEALALFRDLGHRPTEGTVAYRLAAISRGLSRPSAARRYALLAMQAGEQTSTRTTVALAHVNIARLDLDASSWPPAAGHLRQALDLIDPNADRWVLVEGLEATARLLVAADRPGAGALLDSAASIRADIHQPVAPTEMRDVETTRARSRELEGDTLGDPPLQHSDAAAVQNRAVSLVRSITQSSLSPAAGRRSGKYLVNPDTSSPSADAPHPT